MSGKLITEMSNKEARKFFMKGESYFNADLPSYINLDSFLNEYEKEVKKTEKLDGSANTKLLRNVESTNYKIIANKDGKYDWRPLEMIHPFMYITLVNKITSPHGWKEILDAFQNNKSKYITVTSIPVEKNKNGKDKEEQILNWWNKVEQESINLSLEYSEVVHLDITNCYGSIYTHSIAWAIHGKEYIKNHRNEKGLLGNNIDKHIQLMQHSQTNGIPQGSVMMDLIAELVLSYADKLFDKSIVEKGDHDFAIIRYRDDYKIFSNSKEVLELVVRELNDVLMSLNFKLNAHKTVFSDDVILSSIKKDKLSYIELVSGLYSQIENTKHFKVSLQKHLLLLLKFSRTYANAGSLVRGLSDYYKWRLENESNRRKDTIQLVAITVEIMMKNFRTVPICVLILSKLLSFLNNEEIQIIIDNILKKVEKSPNVDLINIWMQRLTIVNSRKLMFNTTLCQLVSGEITKLFDSSWIQKNMSVTDSDLIDEDIIASLSPVIAKDEIILFDGYNS